MLKSTKKLPFAGCATALITPFKNGEIDLEAYTRLVERQLSAGVSALVVCGTTGEAPTLTESERHKLIFRAAEISAGRVPVTHITTRARMTASYVPSMPPQASARP